MGDESEAKLADEMAGSVSFEDTATRVNYYSLVV